MERRRILIIEDDPSITRLVRDNLEYEGFEVSALEDGSKAIQVIRTFHPDLILLDLMLPGLDGFEICSAVSQSTLRIPVIILSARSQSADKVRGLQLGADDYVTKPFTLDELLARVHAVMRRTNSAPAQVRLGEVLIDFNALRGTKGDVSLSLTHRELEVLRLLWVHRNKVVTRNQLLRTIWGYDEIPLTRAVDHFIARLRSKIEPDPRHPRYLQTVYGDGYMLIAQSGGL
jgi:DNA-binding response OmpR family regulator